MEQPFETHTHIFCTIFLTLEHCVRGEKCAVMGEKAINYKAHVAENGRKHVRLFLNTGKKSPFCRKFCLK